MLVDFITTSKYHHTCIIPYSLSRRRIMNHHHHLESIYILLAITFETKFNSLSIFSQETSNPFNISFCCFIISTISVISPLPPPLPLFIAASPSKEPPIPPPNPFCIISLMITCKSFISPSIRSTLPSTSNAIL